MPKTILVCVAWPYANSSLHLGHIAGTFLPADIFARYQRLRGHRVVMVSGSDEHGTPITVTAEKEGKNPQEIVDHYHQEHSEGLKRLGITLDCYFRTSHAAHKEVAQEIFLKLLEKKLIEERPTQALYCAKCQRFLPDRYVTGECPFCKAPDARGDQCDRCGKTLDPFDLKNPRCRVCGCTPSFRETKLHYLKLSQLEGELKKYLDARKNWKPSVLKFTQNWIKEGLNDRPITRDLSWGVPVPLPDHEGKCLYVWFEAVIGYLSATKEWSRGEGLGEGDTRRVFKNSWKELWEDAQAESYYFIGKDNIPFHTIIWPAILLGYGDLNLPTNVPANEYLLLSGEKFSKSRGIGATLKECLEAFSGDQIRYYLSSIMPEKSDANFSWNEFMQKNNEELLSAFGNLINRILTFTNKTYGSVPYPGELTNAQQELHAAIKTKGEAIATAIEEFEFKKGLKELITLAQIGNQYVNDQAPWQLAKKDPTRCQGVLCAGINLAQALAIYSAAYLPDAAQKIWQMLGNKGNVHAARWDDALKPLPPGQKFGAIAHLFQKIEREPNLI